MSSTVHPYLLMLVMLSILGTSCADETQQPAHPSGSTGIKIQLPDNGRFHATIDSHTTRLYILKNATGMTAAFTNYGGRLVGLWVPDKKGTLTVWAAYRVQKKIKRKEWQALEHAFLDTGNH